MTRPKQETVIVKLTQRQADVLEIYLDSELAGRFERINWTARCLKQILEKLRKAQSEPQP